MAIPPAPTAGEPITEAWGDVVHAGIVAMDIQSGSLTLAAASASSHQSAVVFPRPFASNPVVMISGTDANGSSQPLSASSITPTGFTAYARHRADANVVAQGVTWLAYGPRNTASLAKPAPERPEPTPQM